MGYGVDFIGIVFTRFMLLFSGNWQSTLQKDKNGEKVSKIPFFIQTRFAA